MKAEPEIIDFSLGGDDFLIPFGYTKINGSEKITCISGYEERLLRFESPEKDRAEIEEFFVSEGLKYGYATETAETLVFSCQNADQINSAAIRADSLIMTGESGCPGLSELGADFSCGTVCATVTDGRAVSAAWANPYSDGFVTDVAVETKPGFGNRGFASSNVALLCRETLRRGGKVTYIAEKNNPQSARVAEKAGLKLCGKELRIIWYRQEKR